MVITLVLRPCRGPAHTQPLPPQLPTSFSGPALVPQIQGESPGAQSVQYRGVLGTILTMVRTEGPRSPYSGLVAGLHRQMSFASIRIGLYDSVKQFYTPKGEDRECQHQGHSGVGGTLSCPVGQGQGVVQQGELDVGKLVIDTGKILTVLRTHSSLCHLQTPASPSGF